MSDDTDEVFEQRVRDMLAKSGDFVIPTITLERLAMLRTLIPNSMSGSSTSRPSLSLIWQCVAGEAKDALIVLKSAGVTIGAAPTPLVRNGDEESRIDMITCPLPNGEMKARIVPQGDRKAKLIVSVTGEYSKRDDLTVELSQGDRLIEARPMEQKAEVTLAGIGAFTVTLFSGDTVVGEMRLDIGEAKESGNE